jgi:site-specific DNA recombinase
MASNIIRHKQGKCKVNGLAVMRAGLYARVSREEQAEGYSIDAQLDAMRRFCKERGWTVTGEYVEPGHTGTVKDRPAFGQALADCEAGRLDILLTHQLDRFYRNLCLQIDTLGQLGRWGVGYLSVTEQIDYSTPQGMLFLQMLGAFNEYYSANLSRETKKGKQGRARAGKSNASIPPYGYQRVNGRDVPDPETAPAVSLVFEAYAGGGCSDAELARRLHREGWPTPTEKPWTREGIAYLLQNPFYCGWVRHNAETYAGKHEPLISQDLFDQAQAVRARRNQGIGRRRQRGAFRVYLLSGLAVCSECGTRLIGNTMVRPGRRDISRLVCPAQRRQIPCSGATTVQTKYIDRQIDTLIRQLRLPDDWRRRLAELAASQGQADPDELAGKRRYLHGKRRRLRELYLEGEYTRAAYDRLKAELQAELEALSIFPLPEVEEAGETLQALGEAWAAADPALRAEMLQAIFETVVVDLAGRRVVSVKPWPAFAVLFRMDGLQERDGYFYVEEVGSEGGTVVEPDSGGPEEGPTRKNAT